MINILTKPIKRIFNEFFEDGTTHLWSPQKDVYNHTLVLNENLNINNIFENFITLRGLDE